LNAAQVDLFDFKGLTVMQNLKALSLSVLMMGSLMALSAPVYAANDGGVRGECKRLSRGDRGRGFASAGTQDLDDLGYRAYQQGNYTTAINYFTQAIDKDPQNVQALLDRADARRAVGDYLNAIADYSMLRIAPLQPDSLTNIGYCHASLNNFPGALADFNNSLALRSTGDSAVSAYSGRAAVKRLMHDIQGALADCDAALRLDPDSLDPRWQRAVTYYASQQYAKAVPDLTIVVGKEPRFADAHLMLAQCYERLGNKANAIAEYQKANYLYQQAHDDDGVQQTTNALKVLQANAGAKLRPVG
jgi:tetratricopeptide (TPR) repeat protein